MIKARKAILTGIVEACSKHTSCYGPHQANLPGDTASSAVTTTQCDTLVYWSVRIGLPAMSAGPGPVNVDDIHLGIDDIVMQLPNRSCSATDEEPGTGRRNHAGCGHAGGANLMREVVGIYARVLPTILEESYKRHMERQARK